ncbi:13166_t:CDS:2 [Funneliformis geosporum]|uniref:13166_t:CDS:1 n=1 Tax=Funneliformis geosporum TaxID=1117311 RepID=A0A9W4WTD4_9GLOM|nr:13166_t:CDS:2 [Funneliformis geosporum]
MRSIAKNNYYCKLVETLIQAEKESVTNIITRIKDYISQSGIANNLNVVQYLLRGIHWLCDKNITGDLFLRLIGWDLKEYGMTLRQALELEDYIKELYE